MAEEKKRLFIGGLNSGTNEQELRQRFKTFGSVSSVEIHRRQKSEGFPEKTFAYVDIDALDSSIRKCITMLSNTKWKGGVLKIQLAKENFLTRLQKEREEVKSAKLKGDVKEPSSLPPELTCPVPNAVPGTLIPGKKNWVVGKFGRVLPVVHMRPKGGHRICRIDPSKTVHNLKRIRGDGDEKTVSELTWSLESKYDDDDNRAAINGTKHEDEDSDETDSSSSEDSIGGRDSLRASKRNKKNSRKNENKNVEETEEKDISDDKRRKKDSTSKKLVKKINNNELKLENKKEDLKEFGFDDNDNIIKDDSMSKIVNTDEEANSLSPVKAKKKSNDKKKEIQVILTSKSHMVQ